MAVVYWDFKRFAKGIRYGYCYIVKYNDTLYFIDDLMILNLYTLKYEMNAVFSINFNNNYFIEGVNIKNVWNQIEIVEEMNIYIGSFANKLEYARDYKTKKYYYSKIELTQNYKLIKHDDKAIQYISYEDFIHMSGLSWMKKRFKIKYNERIYILEQKLLKSIFSEIAPKEKIIKEYCSFSELLCKLQLEGKSLYEIWNDCELIISNSPKMQHGYRRNRDIGTKQANLELNEIIYNANLHLLNTNKIKYIRKGNEITTVLSQMFTIFILILLVLTFVFSINVEIFLDAKLILKNPTINIIFSFICWALVYYSYTTMNNLKPQSIITNLKRNWKIFLLMLVFECIYYFKILPIALLMNVGGLMLGYALNWIDVKIRLKKAQKIREEYRREHPEENVG